MYGICVETLLSGAVTALPVGLRLLQANTGLSPGTVWAQVYWPWVRRFVPLAVLAYVLGAFGSAMPFILLVLGCSGIGVAYLFAMKTLYVGLPLGPRLAGWLSKLGMLPRSTT